MVQKMSDCGAFFSLRVCEKFLTTQKKKKIEKKI
jgi:hypothetical protein